MFNKARAIGFLRSDNYTVLIFYLLISLGMKAVPIGISRPFSLAQQFCLDLLFKALHLGFLFSICVFYIVALVVNIAMVYGIVGHRIDKT